MKKPHTKVFKPDEYVSIEMPKPDIPDFVRSVARANNLPEKTACHVSIVVDKNARELWRAINDSPDLMRHTEALFKNFEWQYEPTGEYFLHERHYGNSEIATEGLKDIPGHTRRSIVQKVSLPDLVPFYEKLDEMLALALPTPVPHITLFVWSDYEPFNGRRGIGINSENDFRKYTVKAITSEQ